MGTSPVGIRVQSRKRGLPPPHLVLQSSQLLPLALLRRQLVCRMRGVCHVWETRWSVLATLRGGGVLAGTMMMAAIHNRIAAVVRHRRLRADRARFLRQRALLEAFLQARTSAGGASNTSMVQQISSIIVNGGENLSVPDAMARMAGAYLADADDSNAMRVIELGLQIEPRHTHLRRLRASAQAVAAAKRATEEANSCGIQEGVPAPRTSSCAISVAGAALEPRRDLCRRSMPWPQ